MCPPVRGVAAEAWPAARFDRPRGPVGSGRPLRRSAGSAMRVGPDTAASTDQPDTGRDLGPGRGCSHPPACTQRSFAAPRPGPVRSEDRFCSVRRQRPHLPFCAVQALAAQPFPRLSRRATRAAASATRSTARRAPATVCSSQRGACPVLCSAATAWLTLTPYRLTAARACMSSNSSSRSVAGLRPTCGDRSPLPPAGGRRAARQTAPRTRRSCWDAGPSSARHVRPAPTRRHRRGPSWHDRVPASGANGADRHRWVLRPVR